MRGVKNSFGNVNVIYLCCFNFVGVFEPFFSGRSFNFVCVIELFFISILFTVCISKAHCGPQLDWGGGRGARGENGCPAPLTTSCTELNQ